MIRRRSEDELVVDNSDNEEPVFETYLDGEDLVIQASDKPEQWVSAAHPVEIEQ